MKIKAVGEIVVVRVDPPEDAMRRQDGVQDRMGGQRCTTPPSTGIVTSLGSGFEIDRSELPVEERYRAQFRYPEIKVGDHVLFTRYAVPQQVVELVDEGIDYLALPGIAILAIIEEE